MLTSLRSTGLAAFLGVTFLHCSEEPTGSSGATGGRAGTDEAGAGAAGGGAGGGSNAGGLSSAGGRVTPSGGTSSGGERPSAGGITGAGGTSGVPEGGMAPDASVVARYPECALWCERGTAICPAPTLAECIVFCDDNVDDEPTCVAEARVLTACEAALPDEDIVCTTTQFRFRFGPCRTEWEAYGTCYENRP